MTDKIPERMDMARKMGAAYAGNPDKEDVVGNILEMEPNMLDVVFECCGQQEALEKCS